MSAHVVSIPFVNGSPIERAQRNEAAKQRFLASVAALRRGALDAAKALVEIDRCGAFVFEGCASIGEFGERHGVSAEEARHLLSLGKALAASPQLEGLVTSGQTSLASASLLGEVLGNPAMARPGDDWLGASTALSTRELRRHVAQRRAEVENGDEPVVPRTLRAPERGWDKFDRACAIASRKEKRLLSEGQALVAISDHYLDSFDPARRGERPRPSPSPSTAERRGRHVPAAVEREIRARDGDRCALPFCDNEVFLENAHVLAYARGGNQESDNLVRLCSRHHAMFDAGRIRLVGPADSAEFTDAEGRSLSRRHRPPEGPTNGDGARGPPTGPSG
jgi:hypothetical protein